MLALISVGCNPRNMELNEVQPVMFRVWRHTLINFSKCLLHRRQVIKRCAFGALLLTRIGWEKFHPP